MEKDNRIIELIDRNFNENKEKIKSLLLPSIGFTLNSMITNKLNCSKIGGYPVLFDKEWPFFNNEPLTFLGQIFLNQISEVNDIFPKNGILLFFILTDDVGYRYPNKGEFKVIYIENFDKEIFFEKDISKPVIDEYSMNFYEYYTFPSYQESTIKKKHITDEDLEIIYAIEEELFFLKDNDYETHQILGHPYAIQGTVRFWWALEYLGIELKGELSEVEKQKIKEEEDNFILLLQLNFDDPKIGIDHFGDSVAYFGIHKDDLKNKNFENAVLVMQCT